MKPLLVVILFISQLSTAQVQDYSGLIDAYFDAELQAEPTFATRSGFHQFDDRVTDYSKASIKKRVSLLKTLLKRFEAIPKAKLKRLEQLDREIVVSHIRAVLLELEEIQMWKRNPDVYSSGITEGVHVLISRTFAPPQERLKAVIARETKSLRTLELAKENISNPPKIFTEIALEQLPSTIGFFERDVPVAFSEVKDSILQAELKKSNDSLVAALKGYEKFLKEKILPRSKGDFRLGAEKFMRKLKYEEMIPLSVDELLKIGMKDLRKNQMAYLDVAHKIDPTRSPQTIGEELGKDHPLPSELLATIRKQLIETKEFVDKKQIVTIPSPILPIVDETPPYLRALSFASMDTPGPYERKAKEAYYFVTLPEATLTEKEREEYMAEWSYPVTMETSIHEAYPGHYVQFLWTPQAPSKVRKLLGANSNIEGWAHYSEQMMLDEGFGNGDLKLRLGQIQEALLRNCRYIVAVKMHTHQMSFEEAVNFFVKEGFQTRLVAEKETKRGTSDSTYLYYTYGKIEILKLREDYRAEKGLAFRLNDFHDQFLSRGFPPIPILRQELLNHDFEVLSAKRNMSAR